MSPRSDQRTICYKSVGCGLYQTVICAFSQLKCVPPWLTAWLNREVKHCVPLAHRSDLFKCEWGLQFVALCNAIGPVPRRCMYILSEYYCIGNKPVHVQNPLKETTKANYYTAQKSYKKLLYPLAAFVSCAGGNS